MSSNDLVTRTAEAIERLMDLEGKPYFTDGRGPSPVYEIRSVIQSLEAEIEGLRGHVQSLIGLVEANSMPLSREEYRYVGEARAALKGHNG